MAMVPRCSCGCPVVSFNECKTCGEWGCPECEFADGRYKDRCKDCAKEIQNAESKN